jgi:hypothetical protein
MDLNQVVVTVTHGSPARLSHPVYDTTSHDFSGVIKPGKTADASLGFSVPASDADRVTMTIDFDGVHKPSTFTGSVG